MVTEADIKKHSSRAVYDAYKKKKASGTKARVREYSVVFDAPGSGPSGRRIIKGTSSQVQKQIATERAAQEAAKRQAETKAQQEANKLRQEMLVARRNRDKSLEATKAIQLREQLTRVASIRGRAFTKTEAKRFLAGGTQALRAGTRAESSYFKKTGVSLSQERERVRTQAEAMKGVTVYRIRAETLPSNKAGYVKLRMPNGRVELVSRTGKKTFDKNYAGEKVVVRDGVVVSVGDNQAERVRVGNFSVYTRTKQGAVSEFTRIAPAMSAVNNFRDKLRQKRIRGDINSGEELALLVGGFVGGALSVVGGVLDLPQAAAGLIANPSRAKQIIPAIQRSGETFGQVLWLSPGEGLANIAGQFYAIKGTNAAIRSVSNLGSNVITRLNPKFTGVAKVGKTMKVKIGGGRSVDLKIVGKIPKQTLASQVSMAGKRVNAVSSVADDLFKLLKRKPTPRTIGVRKPIPGEASFNVATKRLLKKFDKRTITKPEIFQLDTMIRSQGAKGILERSFFLDPKGRVRPSRLGITSNKKLTFSDYMSSDVTFKKAKPAIYVFDDLKIAKYPAKIKPIVQKMKQGKTLTAKEFTTYAEWHSSPTGNAKPIGFATRESEILLSPAEILKKKSVVGYTLVSGKRVKIVRVGVYKPTGATKTLITKLRQGKITPAERTRLSRMLKQQTGLNYGSPSSASARTRYVSIKKVGYNTFSRYLKTGRRSVRSPNSRVRRKTSRVSRKTSRRTSSPRKTYRTSKTSTRKTSKTSKTSTRKTSKASSPKYTKGTSKTKPRKRKKIVTPIIKTPKGFNKQKLSKPVPVYYAVKKSGGKLVKLRATPLTAYDVKDYLSYNLAHGITRQGFYVPAGRTKNVVRLPKSMKGHYARNKNKLRPYRIKYGKQRKLVNGYIEKTKYALDTKSEKLALARARAKKRSVTRKKPVKRKATKRRSQKKRVVRRKPTKHKPSKRKKH